MRRELIETSVRIACTTGEPFCSMACTRRSDSSILAPSEPNWLLNQMTWKLKPSNAATHGIQMVDAAADGAVLVAAVSLMTLISTGRRRLSADKCFATLEPVTAAASQHGLRPRRQHPTISTVWNEPYLETCCRSALHRLVLSGKVGRPAGLQDGPCLVRLVAMGLAAARQDGRYAFTEAGSLRHRRDVLKRPAPAR